MMKATGSWLVKKSILKASVLKKELNKSVN